MMPALPIAHPVRRQQAGAGPVLDAAPARAFGVHGGPHREVVGESESFPLFGMRAGEGRVLIQQDLPAELHGTHLGQGWVYVTVPNADAHFARARDAGALVLGDAHGSPDGTFRGYSTRDPEGNLWSFGTRRVRRTGYIGRRRRSFVTPPISNHGRAIEPGLRESSSATAETVAPDGRAWSSRRRCANRCWRALGTVALPPC
jgi:hypothetical protein